ncbi:hypothetical protein MGAS10270_Spy0330 [Streptococcus pyogenes MGAS10270]|nr:hypothetical protein MGAS10270_Spy0330 [Streptococcus pyogenes MGAS10270]EQL82241.1 hypothetical protein HMPREF1225_1034 [Streptococcus pyogenes UTSW-2]ESA57545.1 hypothetical protein HMPREF1238_0638 [Streptococcus pyogenes GA40377]KGE57020.1 hypothetical protein SPYAA216_0353 [Streptococcus pyogenes AA216]
MTKVNWSFNRTLMGSVNISTAATVAGPSLVSTMVPYSGNFFLLYW